MLLSRQNLGLALLGATILGSGGGGSYEYPDIIVLVDPKLGRGLLTSEVKENQKVELWLIENTWFREVLKDNRYGLGY